MSEAVLQGAFSTQVIRSLINYLNERTTEYDMGNPTISDEEWDNSYFELQKLEDATGIIFSDSPTQSISFTVVNQLNKATHNHAMLSLAKTKEIEEVENFIGMYDYLCMAKMDGLTCSLKYEDGNLVSAETRGNGVVGEDILHNAFAVSSIPRHVPITGTFVCDGEIICTKENFKRFSNEYKNERNFASGSIRLLDAGECQKRGLTFVLWEVIHGLEDLTTLHDRFNALMNVGFEVVPWTAEGTAEQQIEFIKNISAEKGYPIDGAVFKFDNVEFGKQQGQTSHHFKNAIAYKFYDETYPSRIINIEWTMGRTGVLTPVAVFEPIEMDGSTVERASLHNVSVMEATLHNFPYVGQKIEVFKANMIIPQIGWADDEISEGAVLLSAPDVCPICGEKTNIFDNDGVKILACTNPSCEGKLINRLDHFCGKKGLDIKGLSKATLEKLIDWGWVKGLVDIFNLSQYKKEWIAKPGFGDKSVSNILNAIEASKNVTLDKFISSLGIPLIGTSVAKTMAKYEPEFFNIREDVEGDYDFTNWEGFGEAMSNSLKKFDYSEADVLWSSYLNITNPFWKDPDSNIEIIEVQDKLTGKTVVITGKLTIFKNRAELTAAIEQVGGKVASSVSGKTDVLINNDNKSGSAKNVSAQKLGIPILTEEEFVQEFL